MRISRATHKAVKYACLKFHYARAVPMVKYGFNIFNNKDEWSGVICYGYGASPHIADTFNLYQGEILELVRVALNGKQEITSQAVAMTLRELHRIAPQIKIVVSYADLDQKHAGTIYQATNWLYLGRYTEGEKTVININGKKVHNKTVVDRYGTRNIEWLRKNVDKNAQPVITKGKHKYIFVFDKKLRKKLIKQNKPYPKNEMIEKVRE